MATTQPVRCCVLVSRYSSSIVLWRITYPTLVTMYQNRVILFVMDHFHNRLHGFDGNCLFLGAFHSDMTMADSIDLHER